MKIVGDCITITHNWLIDHMIQHNLELGKDNVWKRIKSPLGFHIWKCNLPCVGPSIIEEQFNALCSIDNCYKQGICIVCWTNGLVSKGNRCVKCNVIPDKIAKQLCWYQTRIVYSAKDDELCLSSSYYDACQIEVRINFNTMYVDDITLKSVFDRMIGIDDDLQLTELQKISVVIEANIIISQYKTQTAFLTYIDYITSQYEFPADLRRYIKYVLARFMLCSQVTFAPWSLNDIKG
jgi:hypothetical protein